MHCDPLMTLRLHCLQSQELHTCIIGRQHKLFGSHKAPEKETWFSVTAGGAPDKLLVRAVCVIYISMHDFDKAQMCQHGQFQISCFRFCPSRSQQDAKLRRLLGVAVDVLTYLIKGDEHHLFLMSTHTKVCLGLLCPLSRQCKINQRGILC